MTRQTILRTFGGLSLLVAATVLAGCASEPAPEPSDTPIPTATTAPSSPVPTDAPTPDASADVDPTCETIISATRLADFEDVGWTYEQEDLRIGGEIVPGGLQCTWGDYSVPSDHVQIYGWAPIADTAAVDAQELLLSQGWLREDEAAGVYITAAPETVIAPDEDGYGMTYLFTDGEVTVADTKQSLLLISRP